MIKLKVSTHSGTEDIIEVSEYDPVKIFNELKNQEGYHILLGENIYSKIDIKTIFKVEEKTP